MSKLIIDCFDMICTKGAEKDTCLFIKGYLKRDGSLEFIAEKEKHDQKSGENICLGEEIVSGDDFSAWQKEKRANGWKFAEQFASPAENSFEIGMK